MCRHLVKKKEFAGKTPSTCRRGKTMYDPSMNLPFLIFWGIIFFARNELGWRGILICIGIWAGLLLGFMYLGLSPYIFVAAQALFDCILIIVVFKGDITIR
jgi:hypothetical protein